MYLGNSLSKVTHDARRPYIEVMVLCTVPHHLCQNDGLRNCYLSQRNHPSLWDNSADGGVPARMGPAIQISKGESGHGTHTKTD